MDRGKELSILPGMVPVPETFKAFKPKLTQKFGVKFGFNAVKGYEF